MHCHVSPSEAPHVPFTDPAFEVRRKIGYGGERAQNRPYSRKEGLRHKRQLEKTVRDARSLGLIGSRLDTGEEIRAIDVRAAINICGWDGREYPEGSRRIDAKRLRSSSTFGTDMRRMIERLHLINRIGIDNGFVPRSHRHTITS